MVFGVKRAFSCLASGGNSGIFMIIFTSKFDLNIDS